MTQEHIDVKVDAKTATRLDHARASIDVAPSAEYSEIITALLERHYN